MKISEIFDYILTSTNFALWFLLFFGLSIIFFFCVIYLKKYINDQNKIQYFTANSLLGVLFGLFLFLLNRILQNGTSFENILTKKIFYSFYYFWIISLIFLIIAYFGNRITLVAFIVIAGIFVSFGNKDTYLFYISGFYNSYRIILNIMFLFIMTAVFYIIDAFKYNLLLFLKVGNSIRLILIYLLIAFFAQTILSAISNPNEIENNILWNLFIDSFIVILLLLLLILRRYFSYQSVYKKNEKYSENKIYYLDYLIKEKLESENEYLYGLYFLLKQSGTKSYVKVNDFNIKKFINDLDNIKDYSFFVNNSGNVGIFIQKNNIYDFLKFNKNTASICRNILIKLRHLNSLLKKYEYIAYGAIFGIHSDNADELDVMINFFEIDKSIHFESLNLMKLADSNDFNIKVLPKNELSTFIESDVDFLPVIVNNKRIGYIVIDNYNNIFSTFLFNHHNNYITRRKNYLALKMFVQHNIKNKILFLQCDFAIFDGNIDSFVKFKNKLIYFLNTKVRLSVVFFYKNFYKKNINWQFNYAICLEELLKKYKHFSFSLINFDLSDNCFLAIKNLNPKYIFLNKEISNHLLSKKNNKLKKLLERIEIQNKCKFILYPVSDKSTLNDNTSFLDYNILKEVDINGL